MPDSLLTSIQLHTFNQDATPTTWPPYKLATHPPTEVTMSKVQLLISSLSMTGDGQINFTLKSIIE